MAEPAESSNVVELPQGIREPLDAGKYHLAFDYFEVRPVFKNVPKLIIWFKVTNPDHMGYPVPAYYHLNQKRKQGKGVGAPFCVGAKSEFLRQYVQLFNEVPRRLDRIPMTRFENQVIEAKVRRVKTNMRQRSIPTPLQYNVVDELLKLVR